MSTESAFSVIQVTRDNTSRTVSYRGWHAHNTRLAFWWGVQLQGWERGATPPCLFLQSFCSAGRLYVSSRKLWGVRLAAFVSWVWRLRWWIRGSIIKSTDCGSYSLLKFFTTSLLKSCQKQTFLKTDRIHSDKHLARLPRAYSIRTKSERFQNCEKKTPCGSNTNLVVLLPA